MSTKPPTTLDPTSSIHALAITTGTHPLIIGPETYIHLRAHLSTVHGPLIIGQGCVVGEYTNIGLQSAVSDEESNGEERIKGEEGIVIGDHVVVEAKAVVEGSIGDGSVVECGARVGRGAVVGKYCKISPLCTVAPNEIIPDYTIIYGFNDRRIDRSGPEKLRAKTAEAQVEALKKAETAARAAQTARKGGG
ncbi:MAG: hypothetical protein Q9174_002566 [Haloplaca sp. 1 TL-2023]